jgi:hypothetical protein
MTLVEFQIGLMIQTNKTCGGVGGLSFLTRSHEQNVKKERVLNVTSKQTLNFSTYAFAVMMD